MHDDDLIALALNMYANRIETGNPDLTANDMAAMRKPCQAIPMESQKRVMRLRELAEGISVDSKRVMKQFHRLRDQAQDLNYNEVEWNEMQRLLHEHLKGVTV